jgi:hypothetical protein
VGGEESAKGFLTRGRSPFWNENQEKVGVAAVRNRRDSDVRKENTCLTRRVSPSLDTFAVKKEIPANLVGGVACRSIFSRFRTRRKV